MDLTKTTAFGYYSGEAAGRISQEHDNTSYWISRLKQELEQAGKKKVRFYCSNMGINFNVIDLNQMKDNDIYMFICYDPAINETIIFYMNRAQAVDYIKDSKDREAIGEELHNSTITVNPGTMFNNTSEIKKYVAEIKKNGTGAKSGLHKRLKSFISDPVNDEKLASLNVEFAMLIKEIVSE